MVDGRANRARIGKGQRIALVTRGELGDQIGDGRSLGLDRLGVRSDALA